MYVCWGKGNKIPPLNRGLSKYGITSHILLKESEDKCLLWAGEGRQEENKAFHFMRKL